MKYSRIVCLSCPNIFALLVSQLVSQFFLDEYTGCVGFLRDLLMPPVGFFALINKGERRVDFIFDVFNFLSGTNDHMSVVHGDDVYLCFQLIECLTNIPHLVTGPCMIHQIAISNDCGLHNRIR